MNVSFWTLYTLPLLKSRCYVMTIAQLSVAVLTSDVTASKKKVIPHSIQTSEVDR